MDIFSLSFTGFSVYLAFLIPFEGDRLRTANARLFYFVASNIIKDFFLIQLLSTHLFLENFRFALLLHCWIHSCILQGLVSFPYFLSSGLPLLTSFRFDFMFSLFSRFFFLSVQIIAVTISFFIFLSLSS